MCEMNRVLYRVVDDEKEPIAQSGSWMMLDNERNRLTKIYVAGVSYVIENVPKGVKFNVPQLSEGK